MIFILSLLHCISAIAATASLFPDELRSFFGPPPALYSKTLRPQAKLLSRANAKSEELTLIRLANDSEFADYAEFLLGQNYAKKKNFAQSIASFDRLLSEYPHSPLAELSKPIRLDAILSLGILAAKKGQRKIAIKFLTRGLNLLPWKEWDEHEEAVRALLDVFDSESVLYDAYLGEALLALPAESPLRMELAEDISSEDIRSLTNLAKYHGAPTALGVKPVNPDAELFDEAMTQILHKKWADAIPILEKLEANYPQSEHLDRARFWQARCFKETGKLSEAISIFGELWRNNPFSYYGLQSAEILGKDPLEIVRGENTVTFTELEGALLPRQILGLWKIRALLENGLFDFAKLEAESLYAYRPTGTILGQSSAAGALAMAMLYASAGEYGAGFLHAYAGLNIDPALISHQSLTFLFPDVFKQEMLSASQQTNINPFLLLSLTKQESAFDSRALSHSDAFGLMQLLPSTARTMGDVPRRRDLFQTKLNTELGSQYLRKLLDQFNGNVALALAAYNAGPTRVASWQKVLENSELFKDAFPVDVFIDFIPFQETRKYVASILRNYTWYKLLNKDGSLVPIQELAFQWQKNPPVKSEKLPNQNP